MLGIDFFAIGKEGIEKSELIMLEQCNDFCGWTSGIVAALSFGSFGVPIKLISNVKVDPLVMQVIYHLYYIILEEFLSKS